MKDFYDYLRNKKVIVVGPAYYLNNQNKGDYIDNFDVVVRISEPMHQIITNEDKNNFGNKMNILYLPPSLSKIFITQETFIVKSWGEKIVFTIDDINLTYKRWEENNLKWIIGRSNFEKDKINSFNYLNMPQEWINQITKKSKLLKIKSTGILVTLHLLQTPLKSLNIIGFDFYDTGYFHAKNSWEIGRSKLITKKNEHLKFYKKLVEENNKLMIDDYLKEILNKYED